MNGKIERDYTNLNATCLPKKETSENEPQPGSHTLAKGLKIPEVSKIPGGGQGNHINVNDITVNPHATFNERIINVNDIEP
ncbi:hypothetical protein KKD49_02725 [Myxococcota bacterium]|nr:hypothetical protein [Myxococcota bacterium]